MGEMKIKTKTLRQHIIINTVSLASSD